MSTAQPQALDNDRTYRSGAADRAGSFESGLDDLLGGMKNWRLCHLMGLGEIRRRYSRSKLGQFWLTLSTLIMVVTLGVVWSTLWHQPVDKLMPYIAASMILWTFISGLITEATTALVSAGPMYLNQGMSFSTAIYALTYKHLMIFLHNAPIIGLVFLFFLYPVNANALLAIPGLALVLIALTWIGYVVAIMCLRFRDVSQVVQSLITISFFITPVLWKADQIPAQKQWFILFNPFATLLSVVRDPLLGHAPPLSVWLMATLIAFGGLLVTIPIVGRYRKLIIYWM